MRLSSVSHALTSPRCLAALLSLGALLWYIFTLLPGIDWGEGARSQLRACLAQADSSADGYPAYFYLGHLFSRLPLGEPAWRINLSSAIYGALAILFFAIAGFEILAIGAQDPAENSTRSPAAAAPWSVTFASVALGISQAFWFCSTHPRSLSLNMVALTAAICLAVRWMRQPQFRLLAALGFVLGLSVGVRLDTALLTPVFLATLAVRGRQQRLAPSRKVVLGIAACYLAGLSPYLYVLLRDMARIKQPFIIAALALGAPLSGGPTQGFIQMLWGTGRESLMALSYSFFPWGIAAGLIGVLRLRRQRLLLLLLGTCLAADWLLPVLVPQTTEPMRTQPACLLFAFFIAPGWEWILSRKPKLVWPGFLMVLLIPPVVYSTLPVLLARIPYQHSRRQGQPIRYRLNPSGRGDTTARRFGESLLRLLPVRATLLAHDRADSSAYSIASFLQYAEQRRTDLTIDELRGYGDRIALEHLARLNPGRQTFYLTTPSLYETADCHVDPLLPSGGSGEPGLSRATCRAAAETTSTLPAEDAIWMGRITLMNSTMRLQTIYVDDLWYARVRFGDSRFYPREARVDHLEVRPGAIAFTYAGITFTAKVAGDSMLGKWWIPAAPDWHGQWEVAKR